MKDEELIEQLKEYKITHKMTFTDIAERLGVSLNLVYRWFNGSRKLVTTYKVLTAKHVDKIIELLNEHIRSEVSIPLNVLEKIKTNQPELEPIISELLQMNGDNKVGLIEKQLSQKVNFEYLEIKEQYGLSQCRIGKEYREI